MKNKITQRCFIFIFSLFFLSAFQITFCLKRQTINAEIFIKSYSTWAIEKKFVVGEEDQDKNKEKSQSKKAKAEVVITRYEESPQFFDQHGNPKTYKIKVDVEYRIICEDEKDFSGKFSAHEIFLSSNPRDYTLSVSKSKLTIERKIIHKVISQIQKMCFR
jgi:hypothetical protein